MTLYFDELVEDPTFTVSVSNLPDVAYRLLLSSEYAKKLEPNDPDAIAPWSGLDLAVVETNDRYTTFGIANNAPYRTIRDNFYNGIYNIKIASHIGLENDEYIYEGTAKVITLASQDATRNIKKYESDDETNSGYVFYSETL